MDDRHARIAVITGAAQGLGRETAMVLAAAGHRVVLIDLQSPDAVLAELRAAGHDGLALTGDVADETFVQHAVAAPEVGPQHVRLLPLWPRPQHVPVLPQRLWPPPPLWLHWPL